MVTDIAALQYYYGVNNQYNIGDNTYTLSSFSSDFNYIYASIGTTGRRYISWHDQSTSANIDLAAGSYSFGNISSQSDEDLDDPFLLAMGFWHWYNCIIENAKEVQVPIQ